MARTEILPAAPAAAPREPRRERLARRLDALGLATRVPAHLRMRPRRVDVLLDGRPAALLMKSTTPLFARE